MLGLVQYLTLMLQNDVLEFGLRIQLLSQDQSAAWLSAVEQKVEHKMTEGYFLKFYYKHTNSETKIVIVSWEITLSWSIMTYPR